MKKHPIIYFPAILALLILPFISYAADFDLKISEIMYNPAGSDANREWIEIVNTGQENVIFAGDSGAGKWRIEDNKGCHFLKEPPLDGDSLMAPGEYFIIANFKTLNEFKTEYPDFYGTLINSAIYLSNSSDSIKLIKLSADSDKCSNGTVIDQVNYSSDWGASGDNNGNKSLERIDTAGPNNSSNWKESGAAGGTPGMKNSPVQASGDQPVSENPPEETNPANNPLETTQSETPPQENDQPPQANPEYSKDVALNEVLPDPAGSDMEGEWIEIYNQGENQVDLSLWQLDDGNGGSDPYVIPQGTFISPKSYLVFSRQTTNIALNNEGDAVRLFWPDGNIANEVSFSEKAPEGQSYNRTNQGWVWSKIMTPGSANIADANNSPTEETGAKEENNPQDNQNNNKDENPPADISQTPQHTTDKENGPTKTNGDNQAAAATIINKKFNAVSAVFWGLGVAFFLGFLFFWIKKKLPDKD